ncbi:MAG TPA: alpha/beta hydrolase [Frankiaceae bacterium]|nr:alpha/beta hydrolase [Frankiaceae bacterium]
MKALRLGLATTTTLLAVSAVCAASAPAIGAPAPQRGGQPTRSAPRTAAVSMLSTTPRVALGPCSDAADNPGWLCGSVPVPFDRAHPAARSISIGIAIFPHTDQSTPAAEPVFVTDGGPGDATTASKLFRTIQFGQLIDHRDLVLIDNRGTGTSGAINCPALQDGVTDPQDVIASVGACGAQLGPDADRYGAGDVALDTEAVRKALGYPLINYYGQSYGTVDQQAYAVRFRDRLRTLVLDAGFPVNDAQHARAWGLGGGAGMARVAGLACLRAPACAAAQPDARQALAELVRLVRTHPVDGSVRDASGQSRPVHVDEGVLIDIAGNQSLSGGELAAAADALSHGDSGPLVRLAGELPDFTGSPGAPQEHSVGDQAATSCNDVDFVWNRTDSIPVRDAKYRKALAGLNPASFAPFSKAAWVNHLPGAEACLRWPAPDRFTPAVPPGATVHKVPTLILSGDLDTNVDTTNTRALLRVFPDAWFVPVPGAGHPADSVECANGSVQDFVRAGHRTGDTCTDPANVAPAVPKFPLTADHATPATSLPGDTSTTLDHRIATVGVRTVLDAWLRSFRPAGNGTFTGVGVGLRGGTFSFDYHVPEGPATIQLDQARFTCDVAVSGDTEFTFTNNGLHLAISVTGPHGQNGTLTADGLFGSNRPYGDFSVTGSLGGHPVKVRVPAN